MHHLHKLEEWIIYQESFWLGGPSLNARPQQCRRFVGCKCFSVFNRTVTTSHTSTPHSLVFSFFLHLLLPFSFFFLFVFAQMKCLPWRCLPLKVAEAAKCSRGTFLCATEQKHLIAFWNKCVYFERRCSRRCVIAKPWVWRELCQLPQSWIFSIPLHFHYEKCSWLRWLSSLLYQAVSDRLGNQPGVVSDRDLTDRRTEVAAAARMREESVWLQGLCLFFSVGENLDTGYICQQ